MQDLPNPMATNPTGQGNTLYQSINEKTHTDKVLGKEVANKIEDLIKKDQLELEDLRLISYYLADIESKLHNFGGKDRFILGKYIIWIRKIITCQEYTIKTIDQLRTNKDTTELTLQAYDIIKMGNNEEAKVHITQWLYWARSSLSLGGTGFNTLNTQSFEYEYNQRMRDETVKPGLFGSRGNKS
jgi:hypothetical protein